MLYVTSFFWLNKQPSLEWHCINLKGEIMAESHWWVSNIRISILLKKGWFSLSEYPWNEKNNTFAWLSSLYNAFKYLTCLRLELSHLNEHRFEHNFQDCVNPLCSCSVEPESKSHFFLCCHHYTVLHADLMKGLIAFWKFPC